MSLINQAITEEEAKKMGGVAISFPCRQQDELWIINNMIKDLERNGDKWVVVKSVYKTRGSTGNFGSPALELWKLN